MYHGSESQKNSDKNRQNKLEKMGWLFYRIPAREILNEPFEVFINLFGCSGFLDKDEIWERCPWHKDMLS
jgi:hypothetical protein